MNDAELAWVTGFLEGEGCFFLLNCNNKRYGLYQYPRISCCSTDLDTLERLKAYTGVGRIARPRQRGTDKPRWDWAVSKSGQAVDLMKAIYPFLGQRRRARIDEVLDTAGWSPVIRPADRRLDQFSWVVGYLEGEGAFYWMTFEEGRYGPYYYPRVGVGCTDQDVIERLPQYTGLGQITGPYHRKAPRKTVWNWTITAKADAVSFMEAVRPHMCSRRQARITEVLGICGRGTVPGRTASQLGVIDLATIEAGNLPEREPEAPDAATLYATPDQTQIPIPSRPERGRR